MARGLLCLDSPPATRSGENKKKKKKATILQQSIVTSIGSNIGSNIGSSIGSSIGSIPGDDALQQQRLQQRLQHRFHTAGPLFDNTHRNPRMVIRYTWGHCWSATPRGARPILPIATSSPGLSKVMLQQIPLLGPLQLYHGKGGRSLPVPCRIDHVGRLYLS